MVVKDDKEGVDLEPGIYLIDPDTGISKALVRGEVTGANRGFKGILAYGPQQNSRTSSHDALAVIDGELTLFNRFSDPKRAAATTVVFGDKLRGVEIIDAVQGMPIQLPKIERQADLVVRHSQYMPQQPTLPGGGHFMIVSLRAPSFIGDGLTFAFVLENSRTGKPHLMGNTATLISHSFLPKEALDRLLVPKPAAQVGGNQPINPDILLYAPNVLSKFKTQIARKSNSPVVRAWVEHLERFEAYLLHGHRSDKLSQAELALAVPQYNVATGQESLPYSPLETITQDGTNVIGQIFNHVSSDFGIVQTQAGDLRDVPIGKTFMRFIGTRGAKDKQIANLPIDRDPKTGRHRILAQSDENGELGKSFILFSGGAAYLMARPATGPAGKPFQTIKISNPVMSASDKIEFIRRPMAVNNAPGSAVVLWRRAQSFAAGGKKEERTYVHALTIGENYGLAIANNQILFDGLAPLTFEETRARIVEDNGGILFDAVTPVRGLKRYRASEEGDGVTSSRRTTPYEEISRESARPGKQRWLRTLLNHVVVQDYLHYREYNQEGANEDVSGLYLSGPDESKRPAETFMMGVPLHHYTGKPDDFPSYVLLSKSLIQPWGPRAIAPNVLMSVVPYDPTGELKAMRKGESRKKKVEDESVKFKIALMFSPDRIGSTGGFAPWLRSLIVDRPYRSLQYTQVIQGTKNRAHEVSLLFFFRADPAIPESKDEVMVASADLHWNSNAPGEPFTSQITSVETLHRGQVVQAAVHSHLKVDAEGSYYWVNDPTVDRHASAYKVYKLNQPGTQVNSRGGFNHLREPDEIRETDLGHTNGKRAIGGRWEMLTSHALVDTIAGLREQADKRLARENRKRRAEPRKADEPTTPESRQLPSLGDGLAEQQLLAGFERALDQMATVGPTQLRRPHVFVVDKELKEKFKWTLFTKLVQDSNAFSIQNKQVSLLSSQHRARRRRGVRRVDLSARGDLRAGPRAVRGPRAAARLVGAQDPLVRRCRRGGARKRRGQPVPARRRQLEQQHAGAPGVGGQDQVAQRIQRAQRAAQPDPDDQHRHARRVGRDHAPPGRRGAKRRARQFQRRLQFFDHQLDHVAAEDRPRRRGRQATRQASVPGRRDAGVSDARTVAQPGRRGRAQRHQKSHPGARGAQEFGTNAGARALGDAGSLGQRLELQKSQAGISPRESGQHEVAEYGAG